ncbi:alpha-amylase family glycosyl hydrolase [Amnibacterium sp. CER49]|uniref:alpha-amylase family glycosyl hydrolase n=1 Tax=Amnibacterium sp. CER49 TaxID=3039161 RepID=UPI00244824D4|nr:alpha-amylase family glycosyl hydrolase [Amnibacterium sp. CER49]MDH2442784.1 alpha-amylase family glycosyl hydrolase [Amnibacterium sp. CER49]
MAEREQRERRGTPRQQQGPDTESDSRDWIHHSVVYGIDVLRFADSDGDGDGDLPGLIDRLDHIESLGVDCLWLLPFYPSERRDNGYDITNQLGVDPRVGTLDDFRRLAQEAHSRGIRLMLDLVLHHTSDLHAWFQAGESDPRSRFREYYIWSEEEPPDSEQQSAFPGERGAEDGIWSWSERAQAYYRHKFYDFEPDLRIASDAVWEEAKRIIDFWVAMGADAFRIDAAGELCAPTGIPGADADLGQRLDDLRAYLQERAPGVALLGEVDLPAKQLPQYVEPDRIDQLLAFLPNNNLTYALATEDAEPLLRAVSTHEAVTKHAGWRQFLRNLDELNMAQLTDAQRQEVFRVFAPDPDMRIYGRGIRRAWAPMMGDPARLRMTLSLLFALPGSPLLVAGQEIGMGDDLSREGRSTVRLPMQWTADPSGFSSSRQGEAAGYLVDGPYGARAVNVADQDGDPGSLLNLTRALIRLFREHPGIASPRTKTLKADTSVVGFRYGDVIAVHNLAGGERPLPKKAVGAEPLLAERVEGDRLGAYGFLWARLS